MRGRDRRIPHGGAVGDIHREHAAVVEAGNRDITRHHRRGRAAQGQARNLLFRGPELRAVGQRERAQRAVDRAHDDFGAGHGRSGKDFAFHFVRASVPCRRRRRCTTTCPSAEPTATTSLPTPVPPESDELGFHAPELLAGLQIERRHVAVTARGEQPVAGRSQSQPEAQLLAAAADAGTPELLDANRRALDVGELRGLLGFLFLRIARDQCEHRGERGPGSGVSSG